MCQHARLAETRLILRQLSAQYPKGVPKYRLREELACSGVTDLESILAKLRTRNDIRELSDGRYQLVDGRPQEKRTASSQHVLPWDTRAANTDLRQ